MGGRTGVDGFFAAVELRGDLGVDVRATTRGDRFAAGLALRCVTLLAVGLPGETHPLLASAGSFVSSRAHIALVS